MSVRRLADVQPESFAFSDANMAWAKKEIAKYPEGRQASAVISLLWRAQDQEGWVTEPAIDAVAAMLDMPKIRVLEVATFYTQFNLAPVGDVAHIQVCGTTPCWLRGANDIKDVCKRRIHADQHHRSSDGKFSWEEVECLGACVNAPMVLIGSDTFEDLTAETFDRLIDDMAAGKRVEPGPQVDRQFAAPMGGPTTLTDPSLFSREARDDGEPRVEVVEPQNDADDAPVATVEKSDTSELSDADRPETLSEARDGKPDDLKRISGVGPKIEGILHSLGIYHFDQIAAWQPREVEWVDAQLKFKGRIARENWIDQAKALGGGEAATSGDKPEVLANSDQAPIAAGKPNAAAPSPPDPDGSISQAAEKKIDGQSTEEKRQEKIEDTEAHEAADKDSAD
ncbi:NADH-quinone oxidoreductase subunit NuoE [Bauldia litoralis]|uniref:NADH-quinone oxidoreductase subunit E n=1 Tax=Bauldia litoralis TaxID=665467 RepID=A0A1G6AW86_9HYPH|nr:NADH-quinone oxidoreductase subunit E [Bauldia litoralis]